MSSPSQLAAEAPYPIRPLELVTGLLAGLDAPPVAAATRPAARLADGLRAFITGAIAERASFVSFSGGRDSSAVLALATDAARRCGLPDPVPITLRIVGSAGADETEWQELVIRHLALDDWVRVSVTDELDALGPVAARVMGRHGLLYPFNAYVHDLIIDHMTPGGVLLTGAGGDELLDGSYADHHARARLGLDRWTPRSAAGALTSVAAKPLYDLLRLRPEPRLAWLRASAQAKVEWRINRSQPPGVRGWARSIATLPSMRAMRALRLGQQLIAAAREVSIEHPFLDSEVVRTAMAQGGAVGLGGRTLAMRELVQNLLPAAVAGRQTKATFEDAVWTDMSRRGLRSGELVDVIAADRRLARHLDLAELAREWCTARPHAMTGLLAQAAQFSLYR